MSKPNIPCLTLSRGRHVVEIYDPRPHPERLGARFVQGGWVAAWLVDGRTITGRCSTDWLSFDGIGLPETFETGLAWHLVEPGRDFMRIGAGRLGKTRDPNEIHAIAEPTVLLEWEVEHSADRAVFRTSDMLKQPRIGYQLEREIRLEDDGVVSTTTLVLDSTWPPLQPISWFAHPFFAQDRHDGTSVELPAGVVLLPEPGRQERSGRRSGIQPAGAACGADGRWRMQAADIRATFGGVWGTAAAITVHLQDGGRVRMDLDRPLDHLALYASDGAFSVEPKWGRTWPHAERASWTLRYRFQP